MPEAVLYTAGKPDNAGGPSPGSTYTWKPVYAGSLAVCTWEARQSRSLVIKTHCEIDGSRFMPEAMWYTSVKPGEEGNGHTSTLTDMDNGTWMEALWTGRPGDDFLQ